MNFELWLQKIADFLVAAGVAPEDGPMAALALIYLVLTCCALGIVVLLLRRNLRVQKTTAEPQEEAPMETPEAAGESAESAEVVEPSEPANAEEVPVAAEPETVAVVEIVEREPVSLYQRMRQGLAKTRSSLVGRMDELLGSHGRLDEEFLEEMEELLITADFGMQTTQDLVQALAGRLKEIDPNEPAQLHDVLGEEIRARLKTGSSEWPVPESGPLVIMVVGVNGVGKTTTIGKLAKQFSDQGKKVVLGAGDTFRAAAAEQLEVWGERSGAEVIRHTEGSDPGAVAFDAAKAAVARNADVLILDTAGRLHTKVNLMEELKKVRRVIDREIPGAPHETLLVLDATTGQNALIQARSFQDAVDVTGIALTKLDGTAKGGIVVAISSQLELPVRLIGIGEGVSDLRLFDADVFVAALFANN
ncbi:signal recognition particle-docking protein FtsY [Deltaproteobacteria bacterium IMCC39524]|nr:signal recognition particle-docking protein FtsY [Deltaproteobacteria bacterium IMCC39524]